MHIFRNKQSITESPDAALSQDVQRIIQNVNLGNDRPLADNITRRKLFQFAVGAGAMVFGDQVTADLTHQADPNFVEDFDDLTQQWHPNTHITLLTGFNNKTGEEILKNARPLIEQYGQLRLLRPGDDGVKIPAMAEKLLSISTQASHTTASQDEVVEHILLGHSAGGLESLDIGTYMLTHDGGNEFKPVHQKDRAIKVPMIFLFSTPYDITCIPDKAGWVSALNGANEIGFHGGANTRFAVELSANLSDGQSWTEAIRLSQESAYRPGSPSSEIVQDQASLIAERNGPRIPDVFKDTEIVYVASKKDETVNVERSIALFREERPDMRVRYVDAPHADLHGHPNAYMPVIDAFMYLHGFKTTEQLIDERNRDYYNKHPRLKQQELNNPTI